MLFDVGEKLQNIIFWIIHMVCLVNLKYSPLAWFVYSIQVHITSLNILDYLFIHTV